LILDDNEEEEIDKNRDTTATVYHDMRDSMGIMPLSSFS